MNGSLGRVLEFTTVRKAREKCIGIAELENRESDESSLPLAAGDPDHCFRRDDAFPLVQFTTGHLLLCSPINFTVENLRGGVEARRIQVPLALSYAMSIHKAQGQTLSRVRVDLDRIFEKGQGMSISLVIVPLTVNRMTPAYVALSRAVSMEGLEVLNFNPAK